MDMTTVEIESLSRVCGLLQRSPKAVREAAASLGIEAAFKINQVPHFNVEQTERIAGYFRQRGQGEAVGGG